MVDKTLNPTTITDKTKILEIAVMVDRLSETERERVHILLQGINLKDEVVSAKATII